MAEAKQSRSQSWVQAACQEQPIWLVATEVWCKLPEDEHRAAALSLTVSVPASHQGYTTYTYIHQPTPYVQQFTGDPWVTAFSFPKRDSSHPRIVQAFTMAWPD